MPASRQPLLAATAVAAIRPHLGRLRPVIAAVLIAAALVVTALPRGGPAPAAAATTLTARCSANLRTAAYTSARLRATIPAGTRAVASAIVTGGRWSTSCAGGSSGNRWYRISSVNGTSVGARYGVTYLYAAAGLFRAYVPPVTLAAACDGVAVRTGASTTKTLMARLALGTRVVATGTVAGGAWSSGCRGATVSGTSWYRITSVGGTSVRTLYGVDAVYGAKGLFVLPSALPAIAPAVAPTPPPTPTPTPAPTPMPTPAPSPTPTTVPTPTPTPTWIEGIDVSHWQGVIDWSLVASAGKRFAFLKASEATDYIDPTYATNRAQANAAGLLVGAYHFARPDATPGDALAEADQFVAVAAPASGDLLPVLDLEVAGGLDTAALQAWVATFMDRVHERTGIRGAIYVSPAFWTRYMGDTAAFALAGYPVLWIAHWTTAAQPIVPAANWAGEGWTFWQYTSDGTVPGISGRVDLDRYRHPDLAPARVP